ncbi:MAG: type I secretion system permease/ATPase [Alphaproteobacteria bacterium]|nr:type I secretion system permease/ATPase [Alphaproteobacteria bacterium]
MSAIPSSEEPLAAEPSNFAEARPSGDPWLEAALFFCRHHGVAANAEMLSAGLPLPDTGRLNATLFARAIARAGLSASLLTRAFEKITELALPALLLLKDGTLAIWRERQGASAVLLLPGEALREITMPVDDLAARYHGRVIYVKAGTMRPSNGAKPQAWFWDVVALMRGEYWMTIIAAASVNVLALAVPLFTMNVYDRVLPNGAFTTLWVLGAGVALVLAFDLILRTLRGLFIDVAGRRVDLLLSSEMFAHLVDMRMSDRPANAGELANRLKDFEVVREFFTSSTIATLTDLAFMVIFVGVIAMIGGWLAIIPFCAILFVVLFGLALQPTLRRNLEDADMQAAKKHGHLIEAIGGLEAIKTLNAQGQLQRAWDRAVSAAANTYRETRTISLFAMNATTFVQQLTAIAVVVWGAYLFADRQISMGTIIACVMLSSRAVAPLANVAQMLVRLQQAIVAFKGLDAFMSQRTETRAGDLPVLRRVTQGRVEFRSVRFSYQGLPPFALDGFSLKIEPGERVAILGRVGSGKTTLGRLLLGLYEPDEGLVLIDGVDVRQYHPSELRKGVGVIMQDVTLFSGSIRQNIAFGTPWIGDAAVMRAARLSGADEFISENPAGFEAPVGERGQRLSGGQRQALALARAVLHDPPILFLDEPTSAMDPRFEREFIKRMAEVLAERPRTLIISTHRRSLLDLVDRVVILDKGVVIADGTKEQVLSRLQTP